MYNRFVTGCILSGGRIFEREEGIPPFACPFAGVMVAVAENNLGVRARIKEITPVGDRASLIQPLLHK